MMQFCKDDDSYLFSGNALYLEELYETYIKNKESISNHWCEYFDRLEKKNIQYETENKINEGSSERESIIRNQCEKKMAVEKLISAYRSIGHRYAKLNPLQDENEQIINELKLSSYDLREKDLDIIFKINCTYFPDNHMTLASLIKNLKKTYCNSIGIEYMHIRDQEIKNWWKKNLESIYSNKHYPNQKKKKILKDLIAAESFEHYLHTKYVGQKRFSLEGCESFIVAMNELINCASDNNVKEIIIGMAHRGRLNLLVNVLGKSPKDLFSEFEHTDKCSLSSGDVKYHKGFSSNLNTSSGSIHLSLLFNPSHLESINSVVEGSVRARMYRRNDKIGSQVLPVLIHGDASIVGQGVVQETLEMSNLRGYRTGGTIHIVINNQIGFTTSNLQDIRSTPYCTDILKIIDAPILHVNADDPEAVTLAIQLAVLYRVSFQKDVAIDIICFRKLGHNEQDTPSLTQPLMYGKISKHPGIRFLYAKNLEIQGVISSTENKAIQDQYYSKIEKGDCIVDNISTNSVRSFSADWSKYSNQKEWKENSLNTSISLEEWKYLSTSVTHIPENFILHNIVKNVLDHRIAMSKGEIDVDWGMAEHMAFASLISNGYSVRLSGEDSGRGTFAHRHAILYNQDLQNKELEMYVPLKNINYNKTSSFMVIDSFLSEEAVLGFEYGYSITEPNTLTIWEAQFGDFANGAQVIIDQFIASGEVKWGKSNGLVLMLPHGYEGQGPEHSSARLERFLQLCAENNMQVVQPTTSAQLFHVLRRQMIHSVRKPLILLTPKSLLRNKNVACSIQKFTNSQFNAVIGDSQIVEKEKVKRIIFCSGKIYYELTKIRDNKELATAIIRIEQLYPFPYEEFDIEMKKYINAKEIIWCQDEPKNQGAWVFMQNKIYQHIQIGQRLSYIGRPESASPACGDISLHQKQQAILLKSAFQI